VRRILNSATIDERDVRIIRGMFRKVDNAMRMAGLNRHNEAKEE
jgi:tRNA C32,U32 (ribose-2'-O)-methylase TrmJ